MIFSCIIPAKNGKDPKLTALIDSIRAQDFPQEEIETIVVTDGDSESAKAIGIRQARGEICAMFCADNLITSTKLFDLVYRAFKAYGFAAGVYTKHYKYSPDDNSLNRYFSLLGANDPLPFFLGLADRLPYTEFNQAEVDSIQCFHKAVPSLGDNGFFFKREVLKHANLDHYYPMDVAEDLRRAGHCLYIRLGVESVWHRTSDNIFSFLKKRYIYAKKLFCQRNDRRWKVVGKHNAPKVAAFCLYSISPLSFIDSISWFMRFPDLAWFWHPVVCFLFTLMYGGLFIEWKLSRLFQSLSRHSTDRTTSTTA